jgi:dephospho-CoA kinase
VFHGIPIIGIAGGIGSGKSHVARLFAELGCWVIDSDEQAARAYARPEVRAAVTRWWGNEMYLPDGRVNRRAIAGRVFASPEERARLEQLLHPIIAAERDEIMTEAVRAGRPVAFIWDAPLLFEAGLHKLCDAVVFVDAPREERLKRVLATRGWNDVELARRENSQLALDNKRTLSDYVVTNPASAVSPASDPLQGTGHSGTDFKSDAPDALRDQVRRILARILETAGTGRR